MTGQGHLRPCFFARHFAHACEKENRMSVFWLLALPAAYLYLHFSLADVLRSIPDSNEDFHL
jgi:hypothetical protein